MCGVEARIVDDEGAELPNDGEAVGEPRGCGPWITGSYYRNTDESKFQSGWLRTGDVGRIDPQGYITLTDRAKDVIKSGGEWISSVEPENHLIAHPAVREAAVVGVPDDRWQERPLAAVVLHGQRRGHRGGTAAVPVGQGGSVVAAGTLDVRRRDPALPASASTTASRSARERHRGGDALWREQTQKSPTRRKVGEEFYGGSRGESPGIGALVDKSRRPRH